MLVGDTRIELVTSSVSRKRSPTELIAPARKRAERWRRDLNPCRRLCRPLPRLSATPPRVRSHHHHESDELSPSGRRDSNPRASPWQGDALPTEPRPRCGSSPRYVENSNRPVPERCNRGVPDRSPSVFVQVSAPCNASVGPRV